jgi:hypothetical protein
VGVVAQRSTTPGPSLPKEGNHAAIFMPGGEPQEHAICIQNDRDCRFFRSFSRHGLNYVARQGGLTYAKNFGDRTLAGVRPSPNEHVLTAKRCTVSSRGRKPTVGGPMNALNPVRGCTSCSALSGPDVI